MLTAKDVLVIYETLLSSPGMTDDVKISLKLPRKNVLLLAKVIELGLSSKSEAEGLFSVSAGSLDDLKELSGDLLTKAGLLDMYNKLNSLGVKQ